MAKILIAGIGGGRDIAGGDKEGNNKTKKYKETNYKIDGKILI